MTREIFANVAGWSCSNFSQPSRNRSPGLVDQPSIRPAADRLPPPAAIAIIRTVAVSIAAESWRVHRVALRLQANPIHWLSDTSSALVPDQAPASAALN